MAKRVVLAYSGGLDTSVAVRWMIENLGLEVVCLSANVGQEGTLDGNREKALGAGAIAYEELDLREEFARDFLAPYIKAHALYEGKYPLVSALSRPLIVKHQVEIAAKYAGYIDRQKDEADRTGSQLGVHPRGLHRIRR